MLQPLLLQYFLFSSKINSAVFKSLVTLKRSGERVTAAVLLSLEGIHSKCSAPRRKLAMVLVSLLGARTRSFTRNLPCSAGETSGKMPWQVMWNLSGLLHIFTSASDSFWCAWEVSSTCGLLMGFLPWRRSAWEWAAPCSAWSPSRYMKKHSYIFSCASNTAKVTHIGVMFLDLDVEFDLQGVPGSLLGLCLSVLQDFVSGNGKTVWKKEEALADFIPIGNKFVLYWGKLKTELVAISLEFLICSKQIKSRKESIQ